MKRILAAAAAAFIIGAGLATPTQAQSQRFGIFFGDEPSDFVDELPICMTESQIRNTVAAYGYDDISLNVPSDKHVQVRGRKGDVIYLLDFNYCTGQIEERQRLR